MKKAYAESTFKRKYREIGLQKKVVQKLRLYLRACANFYQFVEAEEVWEAIQKTEKVLTGKDLKEAVTPDLVFAADGIIVDEEEIVTDFEDEEHKEKLIDILSTMVTPMDPMPTREQFDAFIRVEEHNPGLCAILEESELYEDGVDGKYLIADIRMLLDVPEDISEDSEDEEVPVLETERLYALGDAQKGKKLYIPENLLCYAAEDYFPQTKQSDALLSWMKNKGVKGDDAEIILYELYRLVREESIVGSTSKAMDCLTKRNVIFNGIDEAKTYMRLFTDFNNNTCLPSNKGQMPAKMSGNRRKMPREIVFGPGIQEALRNGDLDAEELKAGILGERGLPEHLKMSMVRNVDRALAPGEERWIGGTLVKGAKIGPNDPCPCGSGKKYKKCCGK